MTTICAIKLKGMVVMGADRQVSAGHLALGYNRKILEINSRVYAASTGSVAGIQRMGQKAKRQIAMQKVFVDDYYADFSPDEFCKTLAELSFDMNITYPFSSMFKRFAFIVAGIGNMGKPKMFCVEDDGSVIESPDVLAHGSGMEFALGHLRELYNQDLNQEQAIQLVVGAITVAAEIDNFTGGGCDVAVITEKGVKFFEAPLTPVTTIAPPQPKVEEVKEEKK